MAKRKRLTPAQTDYLSAPAPETKSALGPGAATSSVPIAQVAGDASTQAALSDLVNVMETARAKGLMIEEVPLELIDAGHLVRDRLVQDEDELDALMSSLRARGQQTPIELVEMDTDPAGRRFGLVSGWRRLTALKRLYDAASDPESAADFATVKALVIRPESAQDAYVAMVEENEIRVNLSFYERARIAVRAMKEGVYPTQRAALQGLFGNATRSKRSKIGTFITVVEALDAVLWFPASISEKLGLAVAREIVRDPGFVDDLKSHLKAGNRDTAGAEMRILAAAVQAHQKTAEPPVSEPDVIDRPRIRDTHGAAAGERINTQIAPGLNMAYTPDRNRIELVGDNVTEALMEALQDWLRNR